MSHKLLGPLEDPPRSRLRARRRWLVIFLLVILAGMNPPQFVDAVWVLARATLGPDVLIVIAVAASLYVVVAFFLDPAGTGYVVQEWERGGRAVQWFQAQIWRMQMWLEARKSMKLGYRPHDENEQLRALYMIHNQVSMPPETKLERIRRVGSSAINPRIASAAEKIEELIETEADGAAPDRKPDQP